MSWLTGLAGKAEHLLNNLDHAAGQALTNEEEQAQANQSYTPYLSQKTDTYLKPAPATNAMSSSSSVPSNLSQMNSDNAYMSQMSRSMYAAAPPSQNSSSKQTPTRAAKKDTDEDLFAFLNSSDAESGKKKQVAKLVTNGKHSRHSSTSSTHSARSGKLLEISQNSTIADTVLTIGVSERSASSAPDLLDQPTIDAHDDLLGNDSSSGYHSNQEDSSVQQQQLSALELENRLLKNEVASLNQEMTTVIQRTRAATEDVGQMRRKLEQQNHRLSSSDQVVRELRARENDLLEATSAKDSQLGVLRVRLEEADRELASRRTEAQQLQVEKNRILQDHTSATGVQGQALDSLKEKLNECQKELKREKEAYHTLQQESSTRQSELEASQQELADSLAAAQKKASDEKNRLSNLLLQVKTSKSNAETARQELNDYKEKASRILQSKDKLISSLREGSTGTGASAGELAIQNAELEEVRAERELLREELQQATMALDGLRLELSEMEMQAQQDSQAAAEASESLEEQLATERQRRQDADQEATANGQELRFSNEERVKQKTAFQSRLKDRDTEIERLRNQLMTKSASSNSQTELENRLHSLTESLIQKQTMLEALGTEKNSLVLQLERLEKQYRELETSSIRAAATTVNMSNDDEVRQRLPGFLRESPADGDVARKVKRAASSIDKFSIRLGVFLRRYPIARVMVIIYMVLLHVWVLVVLMTYQPEMHGSDYNPHPPDH